MPEKTKKRLALAGKIVGGTIVVLGLLCVGFMIYLSIAINHNRAQHSELYSKGPFTGEAIWVAEDESMYMICKVRGPENDSADVHVYLQKDGEWISGSLGILDGFSGVTFDLEDHGGRVRFDAEADLKQGKTLVLKKFSDGAAEYLPEGTKKVVLTKNDYTEYLNKLPFPYAERGPV